MLSDIKNQKGAIDVPNEKDYVAEHILGAPEVELPPFVSLDLVPSHNQGGTMHCTSYGLVHVEEIMNTLEHQLTALADPEEQWANQLLNRGNPPYMEKEGDSLQNALLSFKTYGVVNKNMEIKVTRYMIDGFARVGKNVKELQQWLAKGYPIYTGSGNHCFCLVGYNAKDSVFIAKNSYGPKWGKKKNGTFDVSFDEVQSLFTPYILYDKKDIPMIFKDVSENSPMAENIKRMRDLGIMRGYGDSPSPEERSFLPDKPVTRAELAEVIGNLIDKYIKNLPQSSP